MEWSEWVDWIESVDLDGAERVLRETGINYPPTVHILLEDAFPPYFACATTRLFYRGADAEAAITALGVLPSDLEAIRLVVTWENADLCTALELPGESFPTARAVLDARRSGHTLRWHPFQMHVGPLSPDGIPTVIPEWGPAVHYPDAPLFAPIEQLLAVWRQRPAGDAEQTASEMRLAGYRLRWI